MRRGLRQETLMVQVLAFTCKDALVRTRFLCFVRGYHYISYHRSCRQRNVEDIVLIQLPELEED